MTASIQYNRPLRKGNWASMLLWGRNQDVSGGNVGNSYLLESTLRFLERNYAWTRIENVDRTTELLLGENPSRPASMNAISPGCKPTPLATNAKWATFRTSPPRWEDNLPGTEYRMS
jgi:hypothetical protein